MRKIASTSPWRTPYKKVCKFMVGPPYVTVVRPSDLLRAPLLLPDVHLIYHTTRRNRRNNLDRWRPSGAKAIIATGCTARLKPCPSFREFSAACEATCG